MTSTTGPTETLAVQLPRLPGVEHRFVELPGLRMHVAEAGSGEPVLLLHGFPQHWWEWRDVIPGLAEHYRVIVPDLRGAGWTDAPPSGYNRSQLQDDILALLETLQIHQVRILAHDWAAIIGYQLCLNHPELVRSFVSVAIPHPYMSFNPKFLGALHHSWYQLAIIAPILGPRLLGRGRQRLVRYLLAKFSSNQDAYSEADLELFLAPLRDQAHARAGTALYRGYIMPEIPRIVRGRYKQTRLTTPTRLLYGTEDPVVNAEAVGGYEPYCDDLTVAAVEGASHFVVDDRPDEVLRHTLEHFAR
jgi:pimeloyl-ACP methyl ester carboxylesterase